MAFKKGQSGNPGGRPKGSKTFDLISMLKEIRMRTAEDRARAASFNNLSTSH
jgi:hypothetical protein